MEPIRTTKTARLRPLVMYREDLDELLGYFQGSCVNVTISDNKNRYVSLDEMKNCAGPKIKDLDIRGEQPGLHFLLNQSQITPGTTTISVFPELRTEEISDAADTLFFNVREFLVARQAPRVRIPFVGLAVVAAIALGVFAVRHPIMPLTKVEFGTLIALTFGLVGSVIKVVNYQNRLILDTRINSPSFWDRHKDAFAVQAFTSAISFGVGYVLGHFLK